AGTPRTDLVLDALGQAVSCPFVRNTSTSTRKAIFIARTGSTRSILIEPCGYRASLSPPERLFERTMIKVCSRAMFGTATTADKVAALGGSVVRQSARFIAARGCLRRQVNAAQQAVPGLKLKRRLRSAPVDVFSIPDFT